MENNRVLFISEDEENCRMIHVLLGLNRFEAIFAASPEDGRKLAVNSPIDLILYDWSDQDLDSSDLHRLVASFGKQTPVVLYTGVAYKEELKQAIGDGEDGYFVPPADISNLLELITFYLKKADNRLVS